MQQREVYDRRTTQDKSAKAVKLAASAAERALCNSTASLDRDGDLIPENGDIVALVQDGSTRAAPKILLGKVLRVNCREQEVLLAHLEERGDSNYRLRVGQSTWMESIQALVYPVDVIFNNAEGTYSLRSSLLDIHQSVKQD